MKTNTITAVPKLRFPEFSEDKSWEVEPLIKCASFINKKIELSKLNLTNYISTENILSDFEGVTKASKLPKTGKATHFIEEDILISNIRPYLRKVWFSDFIGGASNDVLIVRAKNEVNSKYLSFYLMTDRFINYVMTGAKGVKMPRGDISQIKKYDITYPSIKEQQKIADCLASLDDSINAEIQQLDTLKDHKAGLLQNLFPVGEETVPRYRFPEFENYGNWKAISLSEFITQRNTFAENGIPLYSLTIEKGVTPKTERYERSHLVINNKEEAYKIVYSNDFVYNPMNLRFGAIARHSGENTVSVSKYYNVFYSNDEVDSSFLEMYLQSSVMLNVYNDIATGSLIEKRRVHFSEFLKLTMLFPNVLEQQKISDCLSSLANLIESQSNKLETLKRHKQGLMQQLFPVMDEK